MPFDYEAYQQKCNGMSVEQLNKEWENYTRQIAGGSTSTATSVLLSPFTAGISLIGLGISAPRIHNARKKREIIEAGFQARGTTHHTRAIDVIAPMAMVGAVGTVTLGLGAPGADLIPIGDAAQGAIDYIVPHVAASAVGAVAKYKSLGQSQEKPIQVGIHTSHSWPVDPGDQERYGPLIGPNVHAYSISGHQAVDEPGYSQYQGAQPLLQPQATGSTISLTSTTSSWSSTTNVTTPSVSDRSSIYSEASFQSDKSINGRSLSLPIHTQAQSARTQHYAQQQQQYQYQYQTTTTQPHTQAFTMQGMQESLQQHVPTSTPVGMTNMETSKPHIQQIKVDDLLATLTHEEEMVLFLRMEMEKRNLEPESTTEFTKAIDGNGMSFHIVDVVDLGTFEMAEPDPISPDIAPSHHQLHRTSHVRGHQQRPRNQILSGRRAIEHPDISESPAGSSDTTQSQTPISNPSTATPSIIHSASIPLPSPPRASAPQSIGLKSIFRKPLPSEVDISSQPSLQQANIMATTEDTSILKTGLVESPQPQFIDQRQDSGYCSGTSASMYTSPPALSQPFAARTSLPATHELSRSHDPTLSQRHSANYVPSPNPPAPTTVLPDYFNSTPAENPRSITAITPIMDRLDKHRESILNMVGWQWSKLSEKPGQAEIKIGPNGEPDYGPTPPIPVAYRS